MDDTEAGKALRARNNVIPLGMITTLDIPVDTVLEEAKEKMESVLLIGFDKEGELYFASTMADGGEALWLIEMAKKRLMEDV